MSDIVRIGDFNLISCSCGRMWNITKFKPYYSGDSEPNNFTYGVHSIYSYDNWFYFKCTCGVDDRYIGKLEQWG